MQVQAEEIRVGDFLPDAGVVAQVRQFYDLTAVFGATRRAMPKNLKGSALGARLEQEAEEDCHALTLMSLAVTLRDGRTICFRLGSKVDVLRRRVAVAEAA